MPRKSIGVAIIALVILIIWIYRSVNIETVESIRMLSYSNFLFTENFVLEPFSTTCEQKSFLAIIVTSYVGHVELRSAHRRAMPTDLLKSMNISRIFLLAKIPSNEKFITQESIRDESDTFGDILQGSFIENYKNLTSKHLMGLRWASRTCSEAEFILKVDDDTVFNLDKTYKFLTHLNTHINREDFLMGYMLNNTTPRRNKQNKWYVTWDEYPRIEYPPYLSGWYYLTTPKVAARISDEAIYHPPFWIDDTFVTGILAEALNIKLKQFPNGYWLEYYELLECCLRDMIKKFIKCDYIVGPNGGRNNLILEFNEAYRHCDIWGNCTNRATNVPLKKVCVAYKDRDIFGNGKAEVQYIKL